MINLGISSEKQKRFHEVLAGHRLMKVTVQFLDLDHKYISDVSDRLIDGQVNMDAKADIRRLATLSLLDPERMIGLDSDNPSDGQAFLDRMVKIVYSVWVDDDWVDVPVFVGPITRVDRNEAVVEIEAQGKEHLSSNPGYRTRSWAQGLTRVGVIRSLMQELHGETKFNLPTSWGARLAEPLNLKKTSAGWVYAKHLSKSMNAQAFYDGRGRLTVRKKPTRALWTFRDGDGGTVLTEPDVAYASDEIINTVEITGAAPAGSTTKVWGRAFLPSSHPHSPHRLGRNGVPRYLPEYTEDDTLKSTKAAQAAAERRIKELMVETAEVAFDSLVIPHLEEEDLVRVVFGGNSVSFRITKMTISLSHSGISSIGYLKKVSSNTKRIRRK